MAKTAKKAAATTDGSAAKAKDTRYNSAAKRRGTKTWDQMNEREKVVAVVKKAASFAGKNQFTGLELSKKDPKLLASNLNVIVKPGGRIESLDDAGFAAIKKLAGPALSEMKSGKYGNGTQSLLNYCLVDLKGVGGGGSKGFTSASVQDWSL